MEAATTDKSLQARVRQLEVQLASTATHYNDQVCKLETEVVRLQSSLERTEATKQQFQYQLEVEQNADRQKEAEWVADRQRREEEGRERERDIENQQRGWKERVARLTQQCQEWNWTLEKVQQTRAKETARTGHVIASKEREIAELRERVRELETVQKEMDRDINKERSMVSNLKNSLQELQGELTRREGESERARDECEAARGRALQLQREIQLGKEHGRVAEEKLEAEKAAHLDTKFACKVMQLQIEEMQTTLESEQKARDQTNRELEQTRTNLREVQCSLDANTKQEHTLKKALDSRELRCCSLERKVKEKDGTIDDLTQQVQSSALTYRTLQEGLVQVKQQKSRGEEGVKKWVKETEDLLKRHSPHSTSHKSTAAVPHSSLVRAQLTQLTERLRATLTHYQSQLQSTSTELSGARNRLRQVERECEKSRQAVNSRESAMKEAEQHISESTAQITNLQSQLEQCKLALNSAKEAEERVRAELEREKLDSQQTKAQLEVVVAEHKDKLKVRCSDLASVTTSLQTLLVSTPYHIGTSRKSRPHRPTTSNWSMLLSRTQSAVSALSEQLNTARTKVEQLQSEAVSQQSSLTTTQNTHRDAIEKLTEMLEQQEGHWREKNSEITAHYRSLLREAEQRTQVSAWAQQLQQFADEALSKAEEASNARVQVQTQLSQIGEIAGGYKHDRACLLSSLGLLSGTLFPLLERVQQLAVQKTLLSSQLAGYRSLEQMVTGILHSLPQTDHNDGGGVDLKCGSQSPSSVSTPHNVLSPALMSFRKVGIVVLAVLHMKALCKESTLLFSSSALASGASHYHPSLPVCTGGRCKKTSSKKSHLTLTSREMSFLYSIKVMRTARDAMREVHNSITAKTPLEIATRSGRVTHTHNTTSVSSGLSLLQNGFSSLMKGLSSLFVPPSTCSLAPSSPPSPYPSHSATALSYSSDCLASRLAAGLSHRKSSSYVGSQELGKALHCRVTALLHRLNRAEEGRRTLHSLLRRTSAEYQQLQQQAVQLHQQVEHLQKEVSSRVPNSQYEAVLHDLRTTRQRERETQMTLSQLTTSVNQLKTQSTYMHPRAVQTTRTGAQPFLHAT